MSFCKRLLASFLAASLALGVFCPVQAYAADRETPAQWAAWIGEALANGFTDLVHSFQPAANISGVAAWSLTYGTSAAMAQAVRDLPEYKELYGSNPLDHSTVIHAYDGGEMVSVLDPSGLLSAYLWLHGGVPPYDEGGSGSEPLPSDAPLFLAFGDSAGSVTFNDGTVVDFTSYATNFNLLSSRGVPAMLVAYKDTSGRLVLYNGFFLSTAEASTSNIVPPLGDTGFFVRNYRLAQAVGYVGESYDTNQDFWVIGCDSSIGGGDSRGYNKYGRITTSGFGFSGYFYAPQRISDVRYGPIDWYYGSTSFNGARTMYILTNSRVWVYGSWSEGQVGPAPAPDPVPPVGPSSPDIQNPEPPDVPESDGPIQYNTTTNITVTLPDGTTTIVEAPTVDTLPIVHWLSIINSNLVAWSRTIYEAMDGWLANISQWLQEIYSEVEAFKLSMDAWMVSLLSAIDKLGGDWPMSTEDNTNYWNNVTVVNNDIWSGAPDLNAVNVVADDFERLKGKFPVSIPWDLAAILLLFKADPVTPEFSVPLVYFDGSTKTQTLDVDLEPFDGVMSTWRRLVFIAFAGALALKSKDLLENFAEVFNIV